MRHIVFLVFYLFSLLSVSAQPKDYVWRTPSENASGSMPCGGGDIGMNVWVEKGDILFYVSPCSSKAASASVSRRGST